MLGVANRTTTLASSLCGDGTTTLEGEKGKRRPPLLAHELTLIDDAFIRLKCEAAREVDADASR